MSKEKQCECCHEWWYDSDVKENLCPNCYDYFKQLKQQLAEKQNTIDEINKEFVQAVHDWKTLCAEKDKEISKLQASCQQVKTQLAIQELEKVKTALKDKIKMMSNEDHCYQRKVVSWFDICDQINNQIVGLIFATKSTIKSKS